MEAEAIDKIKDLIEDSYTTEVNGKVFSTRKLVPVQYFPIASPIYFMTLSALCEYVNTILPIDSITADPLSYFAVVNDYRSIDITSFITDNRNREILAACKIDENLHTFDFGNYFERENFLIKMQTMFQDNDDKEYIKKFVSSVLDKSEVHEDDDGIGQSVTLKKSISGAIVGDSDIKPIVSLKPYRTFREIDQPESKFLFRMKKYDDGIKFGLFTADGDEWRLQAIKNIAEYLENNITIEKFTILS